jgi:hypothetical protein
MLMERSPFRLWIGGGAFPRPGAGVNLGRLRRDVRAPTGTRGRMVGRLCLVEVVLGLAGPGLPIG